MIRKTERVLLENGETHLNKEKNWYRSNYSQFEACTRRADIPWYDVKLHFEDTMDEARTLWLEKIQDLPMNEEHKKQLKEHWSKLHTDFRI